MNEIITEKQFYGSLKPFIGLPINRSWKGYGSALILEVGNLTNGKGDLSIMIEWSWRVEKGNSIWFGSWSEEETIIDNIPKLSGYKIQNISLFSRLPELLISLSNNTWVSSFSTVAGNPEWAVIYSNPEIESRSGKLLRTIKGTTEPASSQDADKLRL
jgi:hypothetical protein